MRREDLALAMLALSGGQPYTPVQIQKAMFLADDLVRDAFDTRYNFQPYDYGPFDREVYLDIEGMVPAGLTFVGVSSRGWNTYCATALGIQRGMASLNDLPNGLRDTLSKISTFVRRLSFSDLVSSIYKAYPHMRERSVFRE